MTRPEDDDIEPGSSPSDQHPEADTQSPGSEAAQDELVREKQEKTRLATENATLKKRLAEVETGKPAKKAPAKEQDIGADVEAMVDVKLHLNQMYEGTPALRAYDRHIRATAIDLLQSGDAETAMDAINKASEPLIKDLKAKAPPPESEPVPPGAKAGMAPNQRPKEPAKEEPEPTMENSVAEIERQRRFKASGKSPS